MHDNINLIPSLPLMSLIASKDVAADASVFNTVTPLFVMYDTKYVFIVFDLIS